MRRQLRRHCEEPLRRSNPDYLRGKILDCFATLAMTNSRARLWHGPRLRQSPMPEDRAAHTHMGGTQHDRGGEIRAHAH
ncbi:hypothetical protein D6B98_10095 [Bradyrhizobium sp. LVM 105]|uniref:Uncharacterized protein n=1 Tax=Bradyrhizobium frederickii TaxID=2560054 RepID=A0A4Y9L0U2_9BRAD|nr:hypothetical protein D6B98_10095 [Bradyrhizobium sp. LVM 105]TFV37198.1 hypothetical protein E4K66_21135 [Bradyrhizobium frederickii]